MNGRSEQDEVLAALLRPEVYGNGVTRVDHIETPSAHVFLAGVRAFKLMKAAFTKLADLSSIVARHNACLMELARSRPMAPRLYRGLMRVTREDDGRIALGGKGVLVDWLIVMNRFEQNALFDRHFKRDSSQRETMLRLADLVAEFHRTAPRDYTYGGSAAIRQIMERMALQDVLPEEHPALAAWISMREKILSLVEAKAEELEERRAQGYVRHCHGDLQLGNICFYENAPTPFGAAGLVDSLFRIDVLYDVARLLADMCGRRLHRQANYFFNHYMDVCGNHDGLAALPLFLALQSFQEIKRLAAGVSFEETEKKKSIVWRRIDRLIEQAGKYLDPAPVALIAVGGFSGSGKSQLTREIAPYLGSAPGASILRTDVMRKRILGLDLDERLESEGYTPSMSERAYNALYSTAADILRSGRSVIVDAVCASPQQRQRLEKVAQEEGVLFQGFWLSAPLDVLKKRIRKRKGPGLKQDEVLDVQLSQDTGDVNWQTLDSTVFQKETIGQAFDVLNTQGLVRAGDVPRKKEKKPGG